MGLRTHVDGSDVDQLDYANAQVKLVGRFATNILKTGPEENMLTGEQWKKLDTIARRGLEDRSALSVFHENGHLSYLQGQWTSRYAHIFGHLTAAELPLEVVESRVESYQHEVTEHIRNARSIWRWHTQSNLALQSAWEQTKWMEPKIIGEDETLFYEAVTLCSHVDVSEDENGQKQVQLLLANGSVLPVALMVPIRAELRGAIQRDIDSYR